MPSVLHLRRMGCVGLRCYLHICRGDQTSESDQVPRVELIIQLALEEMAEVFEASNPKKRSFELAAAARQRARVEREAGRV